MEDQDGARGAAGPVPASGSGLGEARPAHAGDGGFRAWQQAGLPVTPPASCRVADQHAGTGLRSGYGAGIVAAGEVAVAQKVTVALKDDLTGGPADETVRFAVDGTGYEIGLSAKNAAAFGTLLAPYIEHARKAGRAPGRPGPVGLRPAGSARAISGPGRKSMGWW